jgi:hypothetical protein
LFILTCDAGHHDACDTWGPGSGAGFVVEITEEFGARVNLWASGFKLANDGHDTRAILAYLGHRSIMSTVRYTALTPTPRHKLDDAAQCPLHWARGLTWRL